MSFLIYAYDNNCLYWIENKLFLFYYLFIYIHLKGACDADKV
jgi:hypothetical protein